MKKRIDPGVAAAIRQAGFTPGGGKGLREKIADGLNKIKGRFMSRSAKIKQLQAQVNAYDSDIHLQNETAAHKQRTKCLNDLLTLQGEDIRKEYLIEREQLARCSSPTARSRILLEAIDHLLKHSSLKSRLPKTDQEQKMYSQIAPMIHEYGKASDARQAGIRNAINACMSELLNDSKSDLAFVKYMGQKVKRILLPGEPAQKA